LAGGAFFFTAHAMQRMRFHMDVISANALASGARGLTKDRLSGAWTRFGVEIDASRAWHDAKVARQVEND
jgi:hypothetical protein